jgi:hypothetical protein
MRKTLRLLAVIAVFCPHAHGEAWSLGVGTGPFIFGRFAERTVTISTETGSATTQSRFSAATRAGAGVDLERNLNDWLALRVEGTWVRAPLRIKSRSGDRGVTLDAGNLSLTTFVVPLVIRLNPHGTLRFHIMGGPAYALYDVHRRSTGGASVPLFEGTRSRWGGAAAVGVAWWWNRRFAVEWQAQEIVTASPFRVGDIASSPKGVHIPKPRNGHTTVGIRYRF